tara:strand:- start:113186 stop:114376 length:1191 start_codon:yes stop_codon:yes gene_type:complete
VEDSQYILVTVSGPDHPGITSMLLDIITQAGDAIADMGQAVTHGLLSLSIMIEIKSRDESGNPVVLKEMLFRTSQIGLTLTYQPIEAKQDVFDNSEKFILNCVSVNNISAEFLRDVSGTLADHDINIVRIDNMEPGSFKVMEITTSIPEGLDFKGIKANLYALSTQHRVDVAFLRDNVFRRSKRLIVFDMDSTLIQTEVIDEMAEVHGVGAEIKEITERAMNGELDFDESLIQRVSKLKGLEVSKMEEILKNLPFTTGCQEFIRTVKSLGYKVAIISGGFSFFANALKDQLGIDYAFANELEIINGKLTGNVEGQIVNANQKAFLLKVLAQQEQINLDQVVAIGDGANDLPMLATAGLGIAYHAKDIVRKTAEQHMSHGPMTTILYFLGIPSSSIV